MSSGQLLIGWSGLAVELQPEMSAQFEWTFGEASLEGTRRDLAVGSAVSEPET